MLSCLFFGKYILTKNGLRRNTSADARQASQEKRNKMIKTLSTSAGTWNILLKLNLLEFLYQMICQWKEEFADADTSAQAVG